MEWMVINQIDAKTSVESMMANIMANTHTHRSNSQLHFQKSSVLAVNIDFSEIRFQKNNNSKTNQYIFRLFSS